MSKLTLDEAIKHCLEVAENNEQFASGKWIGSEGEANRQECEQCAADHRQLAEWLTELLQRRERCAQYEVEQISNLEQYDMLSREYEILNERYKETVRLLKAAVEDLNCTNDCVVCMYVKDNNCPDDRENCGFKWQYADEALKLLNDEK